MAKRIGLTRGKGVLICRAGRCAGRRDLYLNMARPTRRLSLVDAVQAAAPRRCHRLRRQQCRRHLRQRLQHEPAASPQDRRRKHRRRYGRV